MATASWLAASAGNAANAGQINQFLGTHSSTWTYAGTQRAAQTTGSGAYQSSAGMYLAQSFTTGSGQTTLGQVWLQLSTVGGSPLTPLIGTLAVSLYPNGAPTGTALASTTLAEQYVYTAPFWVRVPLVASGLTPSTTYQIVTAPAGAGGHYYTWQQSNQTSGASASPDGVTWSAQTFGLMYQVFDDTPGSQLQLLYDDAGARWVSFTYDSFGRIATLTEYCVAQNPAAPLASATRTFTYTQGVLTGVA
jgi:hypothetical protein